VCRGHRYVELCAWFVQLALTSHALPIRVMSVVAMPLRISSAICTVCLHLHPRSFLYTASCMEVSTVVSKMDFCNVAHKPSFFPSHRTNTEIEDDQEHDSAEERIPTAWWVGGLVLSGAFCTAMLTPMLDLPVIDPLAAVGLALLVAVLAVRALGQTDLNPVSGVGKLSQVCCSGQTHHWVTSIGYMTVWQALSRSIAKGESCPIVVLDGHQMQIYKSWLPVCGIHTLSQGIAF